VITWTSSSACIRVRLLTVFVAVHFNYNSSHYDIQHVTSRLPVQTRSRDLNNVAPQVVLV